MLSTGRTLLLLTVDNKTGRIGAVARGWVHTIHRSGEWVNELEEGPILSQHTTKAPAVLAGRLEAKSRRTEHVIHNVDGSIGERNSYGADSSRPG